MAGPTLTATGIRTDLVSRLTGITDAGVRVYDSRQINYEVDELPAIVVVTLGCDENKWSIGARHVQHVERVAIHGLVKGLDEAVIAASVDALETQIMDELNRAVEWVCAFDSVERIGVTKGMDDGAGRLIGHVAITLDLHYSVLYEPLPAPVDLDSIAVTTDTIDPDGADVSERIYEVM